MESPHNRCSSLQSCKAPWDRVGHCHTMMSPRRRRIRHLTTCNHSTQRLLARRCREPTRWRSTQTVSISHHQRLIPRRTSATSQPLLTNSLTLLKEFQAMNRALHPSGIRLGSSRNGTLRLDLSRILSSLLHQPLNIRRSLLLR